MKRNHTDTTNVRKGIFLAILAAALYAISTPFSKLLLDFLPARILAGVLYLGAGVCMMLIALPRKITGKAQNEISLTEKELPYTLAMILLDIAAPICLLLGLKTAAAANASLLNNFEIAATSVIALVIFKEKISKRLFAGIIAILISCIVLTFEGEQSLQFSQGSLLILLAAVCWGFENNCTRQLSSCDPLQIVLIKGIFSGAGSVIIGLLMGERIDISDIIYIVLALVLGFFAYGLSIYTYIYAQRFIGAARTSAYYAIAPFIGVLISLLVLGERPGILYWPALAIMILGAYLCAEE